MKIGGFEEQLKTEAIKIAPTLKKAIEEYREGRIERTDEMDQRVSRIETWYNLIRRVCEEEMSDELIQEIIYLKMSEEAENE